MTLEQLLPLYLALAGVAALVTVLVNILKRLGVITDGQAPTASLLLNLVGFGLFVVASVAGIDVGGIDIVLGSIAALLEALLGLIGQIGLSRAFHVGLRGAPLIGYSHSYRANR